jgi:hypothetical protein
MNCVSGWVVRRDTNCVDPVYIPQYYYRFEYERDHVV